MTLSRVRVIFQFLSLFLVASFLSGILGALFFGFNGACSGGLLTNFFLIWIAFFSEQVMIRALRAQAPSPGVLNSYWASIQEQGSCPSDMPQLLIYADPLPNALSVRRMAGNGSILLSTGLLAQMSEAELRAVLKANLFCVRQARWAFSSLCACLLFGLLKLAPRTWVDGKRPVRLNESAWVAGYFLLLFPWIRFLLKMGDPGRFDGSLGFEWDSAVRKIKSSIHCLGHPECPGALMLFVDHWTHIRGRERPHVIDSFFL